MENIIIKLMIVTLLLDVLTAPILSAEDRNHRFDHVSLDQSKPTHRISYTDVSGTLDGSEPIDLIYSWTWTVSIDESARLQVIFHDFRLRRLYSTLDIGDGIIPGDDLYGVSYTKLAGFSGLDRPSNVCSLNSSIWIRFSYRKVRADWNYDFSMTVGRMLAAVDNEQTLTRDNPSLTISSPNYPNAYQNNNYQLWTVRAPVGSDITVEVIVFDLASSVAHRLLIGDTSDRFLNVGVAMGSWVRWTGKKPTNDVFGVFQYRSRGPSIYVLFTSSYKPGGTGFLLELRAVFEPPVTTRPTPTTTSAPPTSTTIASLRPMCSCPSTDIFSTITTREATTGSHPSSSASPSADNMTSGMTQPRCSTINSTLFDMRFILVVTGAAIVLIIISVSVSCYIQRRRNANKLLITLKKNSDPDRSKLQSVMYPDGAFGSDTGEVLYEGDERLMDILPYGPIVYGRPSPTSYKGRVDSNFAYQLPEQTEASRSSCVPALIHTYLDELSTTERQTEFQTFNIKHSYLK